MKMMMGPTFPPEESHTTRVRTGPKTKPLTIKPELLSLAIKTEQLTNPELSQTMNWLSLPTPLLASTTINSDKWKAWDEKDLRILDPEEITRLKNEAEKRTSTAVRYDEGNLLRNRFGDHSDPILIDDHENENKSDGNEEEKQKKLHGDDVELKLKSKEVVKITPNLIHEGMPSMSDCVLYNYVPPQPPCATTVALETLQKASTCFYAASTEKISTPANPQMTSLLGSKPFHHDNDNNAANLWDLLYNNNPNPNSSKSQASKIPSPSSNTPTSGSSLFKLLNPISESSSSEMNQNGKTKEHPEDHSLQSELDQKMPFRSNSDNLTSKNPAKPVNQRPLKAKPVTVSKLPHFRGNKETFFFIDSSPYTPKSGTNCLASTSSTSSSNSSKSNSTSSSSAILTSNSNTHSPTSHASSQLHLPNSTSSTNSSSSSSSSSFCSPSNPSIVISDSPKLRSQTSSSSSSSSLATSHQSHSGTSPNSPKDQKPDHQSSSSNHYPQYPPTFSYPAFYPPNMSGYMPPGFPYSHFSYPPPPQMSAFSLPFPPYSYQPSPSSTDPNSFNNPPYHPLFSAPQNFFPSHSPSPYSMPLYFYPPFSHSEYSHFKGEDNSGLSNPNQENKERNRNPNPLFPIHLQPKIEVLN